RESHVGGEPVELVFASVRSGGGGLRAAGDAVERCPGGGGAGLDHLEAGGGDDATQWILVEVADVFVQDHREVAQHDARRRVGHGDDHQAVVRQVGVVASQEGYGAGDVFEGTGGEDHVHLAEAVIEGVEAGGDGDASLGGEARGG